MMNRVARAIEVRSEIRHLLEGGASVPYLLSLGYSRATVYRVRKDLGLVKPRKKKGASS